jgi:hypothetical protein
MKRFTRSIIAAVGVLFVLGAPLSASAATSNSIGANPRKDYTIAPGETKSDSIMIHNLDTAKPLEISIGLIDFEASGQNGSAKLLVERAQPTAWSLKPYVTIQKSATIKPDGVANIPITITIPKELGAGSYYSAVQYATGKGGIEGEGSLGLSSTSTTLVFVRVSGEAKDSLLLNRFGAFVPNKDFSGGNYQSFFGATKPKYISYTLENKGNVADEPRGSIEIKNIFGKQYKIIPNSNPNHNLVLLGQTRRIDVCIDPPATANESNTSSSVMDLTKCETPSLWPGRYTAKIDVLYGDNGSKSNEIIAHSTFWYLPVWFIVVVVGGLLLIAFLVWRLVRKFKSRGSNVYRGR